MNKKAQVTRLFIIFGLIVFGIIYFTGMAGQLGASMCQSATDNNLTGVDYFFYCNFNLVVVIFYFIAFIVVAAI